VQQDWLRNKFSRFIAENKIIVAHLSCVGSKEQINSVPETKNTFFYPAFPRVFKNFEVICQASEELIKWGVSDFQVIFTISGKENRYAKYIYDSYKHIKQIKFLGIQSRDEVYKLYHTANCVIFPSKLETWGLPITEAKLFRKPLLLADLEYAHETLGTYDKVKFFEPSDSVQLANAMKDVINKTVVFEKVEAGFTLAPFAQNWKEMFEILLDNKQRGVFDVANQRIDCNIRN